MGKVILLVDDEQDVLDATSSILLKRGYEVISASNAVIALEIIKQHIPDLIIADVLMPEMNGFTFYKELKNNPITAHIPILIVTGRGKMEDSFMVVGVDGFITKPFTPGELIENIENILKDSSYKGIDEHKSVFDTTKSLKILVIGISSTVLEEMKVESKRFGIEVETVTSGSDAISTAVIFYPDIIFVDLLISDLSCIELINVLRRLPKVEDKIIIGYCHYSLHELEDSNSRDKMLLLNERSKQIITCGANDYMGRYSSQMFIKTLMKYSSELEEK